MEFNINGWVWVRLTTHGETVYSLFHQNLGVEAPQLHFDGWDKKWARFEMWKLMCIFGPHSGNGSEQVFEKNIMRFQQPAG